jgi:hypothetical protein
MLDADLKYFLTLIVYTIEEIFDDLEKDARQM